MEISGSNHHESVLPSMRFETKISSLRYKTNILVCLRLILLWCDLPALGTRHWYRVDYLETL